MPGLASPKTPSQTIFVPDPTRKIQHFNGTKTPSPSTSRPKASRKTQPVDETSLDNPDLGPFLLKLARDTFGSGESPNKALDYAIRASKSFERCSGPGLDLAMSLHVVAAIYCSLGRFEEAVRVLERAIEVSDPENGPDHALAKFSGYMQLGDTCSMLGQLEQSILCYESGLKIQRETLGIYSIFIFLKTNTFCVVIYDYIDSSVICYASAVRYTQEKIGLLCSTSVWAVSTSAGLVSRYRAENHSFLLRSEFEQ